MGDSLRKYRSTLIKCPQAAREAFFRSIFILSTCVLLCILLLIISSCGRDNTVTEYKLKKIDPKEKASYGHEWLPLIPAKYRVGQDSVVEEIGGELTKYTRCKIFSVDNWECQHNDHSGSFGCKDGQFWRKPSWVETKIVSVWEYNIVRCKWAIYDPYDGYFWGAVRCISGCP